MKQFKDKNGEILEIGDYVFYTERPQSNYADALGVVVHDSEENSVRVKTVVYNKFGIYEEYNDENTVALKFHKIKDDLVLDLEKVKPVGDLVEFMNTKFSLNS